MKKYYPLIGAVIGVTGFLFLFWVSGENFPTSRGPKAFDFALLTFAFALAGYSFGKAASV